MAQHTQPRPHRWRVVLYYTTVVCNVLAMSANRAPCACALWTALICTLSFVLFHPHGRPNKRLDIMLSRESVTNFVRSIFLALSSDPLPSSALLFRSCLVLNSAVKLRYLFLMLWPQTTSSLRKITVT